MLAAGGFSVEALGTTAVDWGINNAAAQAPRDPLAHLRAAGAAPIHDRAGIVRFRLRGVEYSLLDTGALRADEWQSHFGSQFDELFNERMKSFEPQVVLTFGASPAEQARQRRARALGAAVVLGVRQHGYYDRRAFEPVDAVLTCSQFLSDCYRRRVGIDSVALPVPLDPEEVVAATHEPVFLTYINPSIEKGVMLFARLAEELGMRRPDLPALVVESRGTGGTLVAAGHAGGFDLRRHSSLMLSGGVSNPRDIYAPTRTLLVPSVWEEPAGRVAAEAMLNGIPPIVSDRGGLPEVCAGAGFVLSLPSDLTVETRAPPSAHAVEPWFELIERLTDDEAFYRRSSDEARKIGARYTTEALAPRYVEFFNAVQRKT
jgi:glycosyltransferase involved in cell wall biosynthesis